MYQMGALFGSMSTLENVRLPLEEFTEFDDDAIDLVARTKLYLVGLNVGGAPLAGRAERRHAEARSDRPRDGAGSGDHVPRRAVGGLDPITSADLDRLILRLARTLWITFVVVTHELPSIFAIADRVIMLDTRTRGIIATGTPEELARSQRQSVGAPVLQPRARGSDAMSQTADRVNRPRRTDPRFIAWAASRWWRSCCGAAVILALGGSRWFRRSAILETYFDESVQGLDIVPRSSIEVSCSGR